MPPFVIWLFFTAIVLALLWWVRELRRQQREDEYQIARIQRSAENQRREAHKAQATASALVNVSPEALLVVNRQRQVTAMNTVAEAVFGDEVDRTVVETTRSHEIHQLVIDTLGGGTPLARQIAVSERVFRVQTAPIDDIGVVVSLQDVTELGRLTRARRDLVANISHEIRTPLTSIKLLVETLLSDGLSDPAMGRRLLSKIESQVETLEQLTQELFDLSEIESGRAPIRMAETNISDLVEEVINRLSPQVERKGHTIENQVPEELCTLADAEKVERVLINLMHNAIKFTPDGGHIWIQAQSFEATPNQVTFLSAKSQTISVPAGHSLGEWVAVSVIDTGPGIVPYHLPRIFERLYKADSSRKPGEGTGLGLSIAKHIVEGHGGKIWAVNHDEGGAIFTFTLPTCS